MKEESKGQGWGELVGIFYGEVVGFGDEELGTRVCADCKGLFWSCLSK